MVHKGVHGEGSQFCLFYFSELGEVGQLGFGVAEGVVTVVVGLQDEVVEVHHIYR